MLERATTMDPAVSCWNVVFQRCSGEGPLCLEMALTLHSAPSWSLYLFSKVMAQSCFIKTHVLISDWLRLLPLGGETSSTMHLAHAILTFFSCPCMLVCSGTGQSQKDALAIGIGRSTLLGRKLGKQYLRRSINTVLHTCPYDNDNVNSLISNT